MNWYKKIAHSRTLYHGTSINNYDSIKSIGLIPDTGEFVSDSYAGEYEAAGVEFDPVPVTYATDKENLGRAINAMQYAVSKMLGKTFHEITSDELRSYGMLVIMKEGEDYMEHRPEEETGPWGDWQGETDNRYPAVEPGDYFSEEAQGPVEILIGNKMVDFLKKRGFWQEDNINNLRNDLLTMAIRYHIKKEPTRRNEIIEKVKEQVRALNDEQIKEYYKLYSSKINELV